MRADPKTCSTNLSRSTRWPSNCRRGSRSRLKPSATCLLQFTSLPSTKSSCLARFAQKETCRPFLTSVWNHWPRRSRCTKTAGLFNWSSWFFVLQIRVEQLLSTEKDAITIFKLGNILIFYADKFDTLIRKNSHFSVMLAELVKTVRQVCIAGINHHVDGLMRKMTAPHYDLLPVPEVRQCLSLYHGLISIAVKTGDLNLLLEPEKIYEYVLEPLIQTVQLSATRLKSDVDVSVFTINCLTVIRSAISEISAFKQKIEMIDAMIEGNSDVLVSVQVSEMLEKSGILELYQKFNAVSPEEKKPLSTLPGLDSVTVGEALVKFTQFLHMQTASDHHYDLFQQILASEERLVKWNVILIKFPMFQSKNPRTKHAGVHKSVQNDRRSSRKSGKWLWEPSLSPNRERRESAQIRQRKHCRNIIIRFIQISF